jgi:integrase
MGGTGRLLLGQIGRAHGLRATFRTWGEDVGFPRELLEEALGYQIGTAVERAYRRTDSFDRRRAVMQAWADFCCGRPLPPQPTPG